MTEQNHLFAHTRWFKYDRDKLWLVYTQSVPVIFEPPCTIENPSPGFCPKPFPVTARLLSLWITKLSSLLVCNMRVSAFLIGWILNSVFKILWRRRWIVSFAKQSMFLKGYPFSFPFYNEFITLNLSTQMNSVNWACSVTDFQLYNLRFWTCKHWDHVPCCWLSFGNHCFPSHRVSFHFCQAGWGTWILQPWATH